MILHHAGCDSILKNTFWQDSMQLSEEWQKQQRLSFRSVQKSALPELAQTQNSPEEPLCCVDYKDDDGERPRCYPWKDDSQM